MHKIWSEENKKAAAERMRLRWQDPVFRSEQSAKRVGRECSEETKRKLVANHFDNTGRKASDETRAKMSASRKGRPFSESHKKAVGDAARKRIANDPVFRETSANALRAYNASLSPEEHRQRTTKARVACMEKSKGKHGSSIERMVASELTDLGFDWEAQHIAGYYTIDLSILQGTVAIECDGDYWHSLPESVKRDKAKTTYLQNHGWTLVRLKECDIRKDPATALRRGLESVGIIVQAC